MLLLILASEFPPGPGGVGTHAYQLAQRLTGPGWQVVVATSQDSASDEAIARFNQAQPFEIIRWRALPGSILSGFYRGFRTSQILRQRKPDLILATGDRPVWIAAALHGKIPFVAVGHGTEFGLSGWQFTLTKWAFEQASHVVCVSQFTQNTMLQRGISPRHSSAIPNGADENRFMPLADASVAEFRSRYNVNGGHLILTVGNVTERKGQEVVIRALPRILEKLPGTHYLMVGLPTRQAYLTQLAAELGVKEHIHFLGFVEPTLMLTIINACDLFVMTSIHTKSGDFEGFGIAVVEAALCGKTSVVSGSSGLEEAVIDGETGIVVPQNDPQRTAQAIIDLLQDKQKRQILGQNARQRALAEQTWTIRSQQYDKLFREVADQ